MDRFIYGYFVFSTNQCLGLCSQTITIYALILFHRSQCTLTHINRERNSTNEWIFDKENAIRKLKEPKKQLLYIITAIFVSILQIWWDISDLSGSWTYIPNPKKRKKDGSLLVLVMVFSGCSQGWISDRRIGNRDANYKNSHCRHEYYKPRQSDRGLSGDYSHHSACRGERRGRGTVVDVEGETEVEVW